MTINTLGGKLPILGPGRGSQMPQFNMPQFNMPSPK